MLKMFAWLAENCVVNRTWDERVVVQKMFVSCWRRVGAVLVKQAAFIFAIFEIVRDMKMVDPSTRYRQVVNICTRRLSRVRLSSSIASWITGSRERSRSILR